MHKILKSYLRRLTNLTVSNRSLLLLKLSEEQDIDLNELDYLSSKPSFHIVEQLIAGKKEIALCPIADSRNANANKLSEKLKKIDRREKFIFEERGSKDLYVGWPFVRGKLADGTPVRSPLLFFPVTISDKNNYWVIKLREDVPVSFNKSFLLAYSHYNSIALSDEFIDTSFEDFNTDSQVFRTELYTLLKESPIEINFNQELFVNKIIPFQNFKKQDYEGLYENGVIKLQPEGVLGIFPQAGSYLVPDYDQLIKSNLVPDLEEFFVRRNGSGNSGMVVKEEHTITPYPIDAAQEKAIISVKKGNSLVVEGPPGTGKSQLICNLISDYIARGKNVLLVCQKRAALDVVYERMKKKELQDFVGLVHDFKNDRKQLYDQINAQIEKLDEYKFKNNSLDSIYLERTFVQVCRRIEQITEELEEFRKALFDESECGLSVKELYLTSNPEAPRIEMKQEYRHFRIFEIVGFIRLLNNLVPYSIRFEKQDYLWKDRVSFADFSISDKSRLLEVLDHIPFYQSELSEKLREILGTNLEIEEIEWLLDRKNQVDHLVNILEDPKVYSSLVHLLNKNTDEDWLIIQEKQISECFKGTGIETSLPTEQLGVFQKVLENARQARRGPFKWIKWSLFSKEKYLLKRVVVSNKLKWGGAAIDELMSKVDNRMNLEHNLTGLRECGWLQDIPEEKDFAQISEWFHCQHSALQAKSVLKELRNLKDYLNIPALTYKELKQKMHNLFEAISDVPQEKKGWMKYLTSRQINKILSAFEYSLELAEVVEKDFESLVEYDTLRRCLSVYELTIFEKLINSKLKYTAEEIVSLFENSVKLEWIESIEMKYPVLRSVSTLRMEQLEKELQDCVEQKEKLSAEILLMKVRERTYSDVEYNRLENMVTYRDLKHQVTKKKKIWPLRKLISNHASEIFQLIPCWLASPESVSSVFALDIDFDLVIFDEASQCYAENGIPAMYRGRQVVITGDSKQLQPSDLYTIRWGGEEDEIPELEIDSLLDLGKKFLGEVKLIGHYRSKSLDLIEFSNNYFYSNKLRVLPHFNDVNKNEAAIKFIKVNGIWENNSNKAEANKILELIKELQNREPEKSIGVVTFNYKQQMFIQDLVEVELGAQNPEEFFIKNIENVQGDERDIIIFSVGYAPNASGKFVMNFGSLNMDHGENRLNVAVTRAREKVYVISSILPEQLDVSSSKNEGPKLLKKYLEFARDTSEGRFKPIIISDSSKNKEWFLKSLISKESFPFNLSVELPFTDLTVKENRNYIGLINTDDELYYQSISAKDAHAFTPLAFRKKDWRYKKIYSRMFWESKDQLKESLIKTFGNHA